MSERLKHDELTRVEFSSFKDLKQTLRVVAKRETAYRKNHNPIATEEEYLLGTYIESIHPQTRNAIVQLHKKGYPLQNWGFDDDKIERQYLLGDFRIKNPVKKLLTGIDIRIDEYTALQQFEVTELSFEPKYPDFRKLRERWNWIGVLLPTTRNLPTRVVGDTETKFREEQDILKVIYNLRNKPAA